MLFFAIIANIYRCKRGQSPFARGTVLFANRTVPNANRTVPNALFVMVGEVVEDGKGAVELFYED